MTKQFIFDLHTCKDGADTREKEQRWWSWHTEILASSPVP